MQGRGDDLGAEVHQNKEFLFRKGNDNTIIIVNRRILLL